MILWHSFKWRKNQCFKDKKALLSGRFDEMLTLLYGDKDAAVERYIEDVFGSASCVPLNIRSLDGCKIK